MNFSRRIFISAILFLSCANLLAKGGKVVIWDVNSHPQTARIEGSPKLIDTKLGKAVEFNGSSDGLIFDNVPVSGMKEVTIEAIINPYGNAPFEQRYLHIGEDQGTRIMMETRVTPQNRWYTDFFVAMKIKKESFVVIDPNKTHPTDRWYNVTFVCSPKGMRAYVNGVLEHEGVLNYRDTINMGVTSVGVRQNLVSWFKGAIYKIRFTPKVLSPKEFLKDYEVLNEGLSPDTGKEEVLASMKKATRYMMDKVSYKGGFVWNYLPDLSRQWGEMEATRSMVWTQESTPEVGHVLLDAYHATGDEYYYKAAQKVAAALIRGQLPCGGWNYCFDFKEEKALKQWYSTVGANAWRLEEFQHYYGNATFDDNASTECGKFLLRMYREKRDSRYLQSVEKLLGFVLESQYPCGGWPQRYPLMDNHPFRGHADYTPFITLNDDVIPECIDFLLQCVQTFGRQDLKERILRAMYLCLDLQQRKPYAGWADQYTVSDLKPAPARSYEPASICSTTTVRMIRQMFKFYKLTGDSRFLSGVNDAVEFLESLALPESEAKKSGLQQRKGYSLSTRFVNPETGEPIYLHREGSNVKNGHYFHNTDISRRIGHYSSVSWIDTESLRTEYRQLLSTPVEEYLKFSPLLHSDRISFKTYCMESTADGIGADKIDEYLTTQTPEGYWLTNLKQISNPYTPCPDTSESHETKYESTFVGDKYDTSPYKPETPVKGISVQDYIQKMSVMIRFIAGYSGQLM